MSYYIVMTSSGGFGDYVTMSHFITEGIEVAEAWVAKYNRILNYYSKHYDLMHELHLDNHTDYAEHITNRYYNLSDMHNAWFEVIEKR